MKTKIQKRLNTLFSPQYQVGLAAALFVFSLWASKDTAAAAVGNEIFRAIYNLPDGLRPIMLAVTQLGSIYVFFIIVGLYYLKSHYRVVLRLLLSGSLAYLITGVAKDLWGSARPFELLPGITSLELFVRGSGFPSGHVALATAVALTLAYYWPPKYRAVLVLWIIGVATSRMYLGVHAFWDVVGGFAIGWGTYALFRNVKLRELHERIKKKKP
jgi:undecaprenyl-diphosphatase